MTLWTFLIVAVIFVVGIPAIAGIISDYKIAKIKANTANADEIEALRSELRKLKKRLENVEAIAVADPDGFEKNSHHQADFESKEAQGDNHAHEIENILKRRRNR